MLPTFGVLHQRPEAGSDDEMVVSQHIDIMVDGLEHFWTLALDS